MIFLTLDGAALLILAAMAGGVISSWVPPVAAFCLVNLCVAALFFLDILCSPRRGDLMVTRECHERFCVGTPCRVTLRVTNSSPHPVLMSLVDTFPQSFKVKQRRKFLLVPSSRGTGKAQPLLRAGGKPLFPFGEQLPFAGRFPSLERLKYAMKNRSTSPDSRFPLLLASPGDTVDYEVIPTRRGDEEFGEIWVRAYGILGLVAYQWKKSAQEKARVYPNVRGFSRYDFLQLKGRSVETGFRPSRVHGRGSDFESLREYRPDDEFRRINWKATARAGKVIVQEFREERNQNLMILLDSGRLMGAETDGVTLLDYAINSALLLAYVSMLKGDQVGCLVFSNEVHGYLPPKRGKGQILRLLDLLQGVGASPVEPDYGRALRYLSIKSRKRSLVVVYTDFLDAELALPLVRYLSSLRKSHLPMVVGFRDPSMTRVAEAPVSSTGQIYQKGVAEWLIQQRESLFATLRRAGVMAVEALPQELSPLVVQKYLETKIQGKL